MEKKVTFKNNHVLRLVATLYSLKEGESLLVVIFAHGLQSSKDSPRNIFIAEETAKKGTVCFLHDFTGHGESGGDVTHISLEQFEQDLDASIAYIKSLEGIDSSKTGYVARALGESAALLKASTDKRITVLILRSSPADGLYQYAEHITIPKLIIQGEADPISVESKILYKHLAGKKKLVLIKGADHFYSRRKHLEEAKDAIFSWLIENLKQ